jgi:8-amino-7-oxononanoate synthase
VRRFRSWLEGQLDALAGNNRLRTCPEVAGASRVRPGSPSGPLLSFCSNDYLGLASHPALAAAAATASASQGFGAGAARLVAGDLPAHRALEADLAAFTGRPAALLFPTGYQTNLGVITALAGPDDVIVSDAANHASIIDGCRLSRARVLVYRHADAADARRALAATAPVRHRFLVTESIFSMDGDAAPLAELAAAADEADAILVVDEAHALGVAGPDGRGLCAAAAVKPDVLVGTLGKAFGSAGGFAAGDPALRSYLLNRARTFVFTTGLPPPVAAAASAALEIIRSAEGDTRRQRLSAYRHRLATHLIDLGLADRIPPGPIFPIVLGTDARALAVASALRARRFFVPAIRPPTVPEGTARLRVTLSSEHEPEEIDAFAASLGEVLR